MRAASNSQGARATPRMEMRRWTATTLTAVLALFVLLPYLSLVADADSDLPMCCRGKGIHHCAMRAMAMERSSPEEGLAFRAVLCRCPAQRALAPAGRLAIYPAVSALYATPLTDTAFQRHSIVFQLISQGRSHQKRGPPFLSI